MKSGYRLVLLAGTALLPTGVTAQALPDAIPAAVDTPVSRHDHARCRRD
jgi:hypothetical protein